MCGIFCIFRKNQAIDGDFFHEALSLLNHRGPDEQHQLLRTHPHAIGFGHTRLSIVGVDSGRQPLIYGDRLAAIVNGEFYDYKEIRASYQKQGYAFKTKTDSEIILPMYLEHGVDCFSKLNGEFAGVIYDQENEKIIAFRDRHGVKPLFFRRTDAGIAFSSEIKSIISYEKCRPEFNLRELKDRLFYMPWDQDASIFKDVYNVKPGHYLIYDIKSQTCTQYRYWQVDYDKRNYTQAPLEDILDTAVSRNKCNIWVNVLNLPVIVSE